MSDSTPDRAARDEAELELATPQTTTTTTTTTKKPGVFAIGDVVQVESRTWPGMNKPGGVGRINKINDDGTYGVTYIVVRGSERKVHPMFIEHAVLDNGPRPIKERDYYHLKYQPRLSRKRNNNSTPEPGLDSGEAVSTQPAKKVKQRKAEILVREEEEEEMDFGKTSVAAVTGEEEADAPYRQRTDVLMLQPLMFDLEASLDCFNKEAEKREQEEGEQDDFLAESSRHAMEGDSALSMVARTLQVGKNDDASGEKKPESDHAQPQQPALRDTPPAVKTLQPSSAVKAPKANLAGKSPPAVKKLKESPSSFKTPQPSPAVKKPKESAPTLKTSSLAKKVKEIPPVVVKPVVEKEMTVVAAKPVVAVEEMPVVVAQAAPESPIAVKPAVTESPAAAKPVLMESPILATPTLMESPIAVKPAVTESPILAKPVLMESPIAVKPAVTESPILATPTLMESPIAVKPAVTESPILTTPVLMESPILATPARTESPTKPVLVMESPVAAKPVLVMESPIKPVPLVESPIKPMPMMETSPQQESPVAITTTTTTTTVPTVLDVPTMERQALEAEFRIEQTRLVQRFQARSKPSTAGSLLQRALQALSSRFFNKPNEATTTTTTTTSLYVKEEEDMLLAFQKQRNAMQALQTARANALFEIHRNRDANVAPIKAQVCQVQAFALL